MTFEEFEKAKKRELKQEAAKCFAKYRGAGGLDKTYHLLESQFYMQELDRRHDSWIAWRDFILEAIVIALIGWEIFLGGKQDSVLTQLQANSASTAATMVGVQRTMEAMNSAVQQQAGQLSDVAIEMTCPATETVEVRNTGRSNLKVFGYQFDGRKGPRFTQARKLDRGDVFSIPADELYREADKRTLEGEQSYIMPVRVFLAKDDGIEFAGEADLLFLRVNSSLRGGCGSTNLKKMP